MGQEGHIASTRSNGANIVMAAWRAEGRAGAWRKGKGAMMPSLNPLPAHKSSVIVEAQPNYFTLTLMMDEVGTVLDYWPSPIVAWRITRENGGSSSYVVTPIPLDGRAKCDVLLFPNGKVLADGYREFESAQSWFASIPR